MSEEKWERLRKINRSYRHFVTGLFGLKKDFDILRDNEVPVDGDREYVLKTIKTDFPEYITAINWQSDLLDNFHPLSKNSFAFMSIHLKALKNKEDKTVVVRKFIKEIQARSNMYVVHD